MKDLLFLPRIVRPAIPSCLGRVLAAVALFGVFCSFSGFARAAEEEGARMEAAPPLRFQEVLPGLELALTELEESRAAGHGALFVVLRIDPGQHAFSLSMASESGTARSFADWSRTDDLRAGINAGMYLQDLITSTGYMRSGSAVNNASQGSRLGAFFLAGPRKKGRAGARIIERGSPRWEALLDEYDIVVQNYRFLDSTGAELWRSGGPMHSIAVAAEDEQGRILFLLSQEPLSAERFAWHLKNFDLALRTVMYVEGGAKAGIFLRLEDADGGPAGNEREALPGAVGIPVPGGLVHVWKGMQSLLYVRGNAESVLPNVIGIRR